MNRGAISERNSNTDSEISCSAMDQGDESAVNSVSVVGVRMSLYVNIYQHFCPVRFQT